MNTYISLFTNFINNEDKNMAIVDKGVRYDARQLAAAIEIYMSFIASSKFKERSRMVFLGDRNLESIAFFHALLFLNMVPALIDKTLPKEQIIELSSGEDMIFCFDNDLAREVDATLVPVLDKTALKSKQKIKFDEIEKQSSDIIFITHTSGTTGLPKKVAYTEENIAWAISEYKKIYKLDKNERVLFALPFHYCFGFIACCLSPLSAGKTVVLLANNLNVEETAKIIEKEKVQILVINPYFYNELCKIDLSKFDFSSLRICDSGGDILPIPVIEKFKNQTHVVITEGYGLTETSSLTHFLFPEDNGKVKIGSIGKSCEDVESVIVSKDFEPVTNGAIGELLVKGPMVIKTYDDKKFNEGAFYKDWFRTGDLFYKDNDGYYYLVGRKKDVEDVSSKLLHETANAIPQLFSIKEIADLTYRLVGNRDLQIYVVPLDGSVAIREIIKENIVKMLPPSLKEISSIKLVSFLPRTATGKVMKRKL